MVSKKKKSKKSKPRHTMKTCPYCKGKHWKKSAYNACKKSHKIESWGK